MADTEPGEVSRCPQCGTEFSGQASPLGLCPACLLKLGMSDPNWTPPSEAPDPETPPPPPEARSSPPEQEPARLRRFPSLRTWMMAAAAVLFAVFASFFFLSRGGSRTPAPAVRFTIPLPMGTDVFDGVQFAVSPDSKQIALAGRSRDGRIIWIRSLASTGWRGLGQTTGATSPFWSPDSRHVAFFAARHLKQVDVGSGLVSSLTDAPAGQGGTWNPNGEILFSAPGEGAMWRIPASGGERQPVIQLEAGGHAQRPRWPAFLPDGNHVLFAASGRADGTDAEGVYVASRDSGEIRLLAPGGGQAAYARGFLLYVKGTSLIAQRFDASRTSLSGDVRLVAGVEQLAGDPTRGVLFSVSDDLLVYRSGDPASSQLHWIDRDGRFFAPAGETGEYLGFSLSPDGRRLAISRRDPRDNSSNIWLLDPGRGVSSRITFGHEPDSSPIWSPDGSQIAFVSRRKDTLGVYVTASSGGGTVEPLLPAEVRPYLTDWSRDGRTLVYSIVSPQTGSDVWAVSLGEDHKPHALVQTAANESHGRLSPDGRWISYVSDESGRDEVYVQALGTTAGRWQVSSAGGVLPRWRSDGRELFYLTPDDGLVAVGIETTAEAVQVGAPRPLFPTPGIGDYDVSGDGRRFVVQLHERDEGDNELQVVLNWRSEVSE